MERLVSGCGVLLEGVANSAATQVRREAGGYLNTLQMEMTVALSPIYTWVEKGKVQRKSQ